MSQAPTVKTEAEVKADEEYLKKEKEEITEKHKHKTPRVRPLAETKAIDMGANFISETFMFLVAGSIIVWEQWRSRKKASDRRDEVDEKLEGLVEKNSELMEEIKMLKARVVPEEEETRKSTKAIEQSSNAHTEPPSPADSTSKSTAPTTSESANVTKPAPRP